MVEAAGGVSALERAPMPNLAVMFAAMSAKMSAAAEELDAATSSAEFAASAHGLRGTALQLGALRLAAMCADLERHPANGTRLVDPIREECGRSRAALVAALRETYEAFPEI